MIASYKTSDMYRWVHINGNSAYQRFARGETIWFCPNKMSPDSPWGCTVPVSGAEWLEAAKCYRPSSTGTSKLWRGSLESTAWDLCKRNWEYYAVQETGLKPRYYLRKEKNANSGPTKRKTVPC
ncbi:MAG: hypothetical protein ACYS7Y_04170 [Planctomycetota bacterium]|jgi:hypothetical protein